MTVVTTSAELVRGYEPRFESYMRELSESPELYAVILEATRTMGDMVTVAVKTGAGIEHRQLPYPHE